MNITIKSRAICFISLILNLALLFLGVIWPSIFTLLALITPIGIILSIICLFKASLFLDKKWIRQYIYLSIAISIFSWIWELIHIYTY